MKRTLYALLELCFPARPDALVVQKLTPDTFIELLSPQCVHGCNALLPFSDARVRATVHEVKYHHNKKATELLGATVATHIVATMHPNSILIPIPLAKERKKKRGYNQVEEIVRAAKLTNICQVTTEILYRKKDTTPQTTLSQTKRLKNVKDAFAVYDTQAAHNQITDAHIILLDDVTTTGATLNAAKAALLPHHPASVTCLALAH